MKAKQSRPSDDGAVRESHAVRQGELSRRTRAEHDDLLAAMQRLEAALSSPAPGREAAWTHRVARDLPLVRDHLKAHVESAECAEGLCAELTSARPELAYRIEQLRTEHAQLIDLSATLENLLERAGEFVTFANVRQQAACLLAAIRSHHAKEVDLIFECFCADIGVGD